MAGSSTLTRGSGRYARCSFGWTLFIYLDPALIAEGPLPRTNTAIEGEANARLRDMLRNRSGMLAMRRVKAVFWWCNLHAESPMSTRGILVAMPTDDDIDLLYRT